MPSQRRLGLVVAVAAALLIPAATARGQQFELLHSFAGCPLEGCASTGDAAHPHTEPGALIAGPDGNIYGTSPPDWREGETTPRGWGTVFRVNTAGDTVEILHRFPGVGPGGCGPAGIGFSASGVLYVMGRGCPNLSGPVAIFRLMNGTAETVYEFTTTGLAAPQAMVASTTGNFYLASGIPPITPRQYHRWNETDGTLTLLPGNGGGPMTALGDGHVYARDWYCFLVPFSDVYVCTSDKLVRLDDAAEISLPDSEPVGNVDTLADENFIVGPDGNLYGSALNQGAHRIYRLRADGGYIFLPGSDGLWPLGFAPDGSIYGSTDNGGAGALFRLSGGAQVPVHSFDGFDGAGAFSQLVRGADGRLYGLRSDGGEHGLGVIYRIRVPKVDMKANGADGPITVGAGEPLQISMAFDAPATDVVSPAEVYLAIVTPALQTLWTTPGGFSLTPSPLYTGPLPSFASTALINIPDAAVLPAGDYHWVAIVDADSNGVPNGHYVDFVKTTKTAAPLTVLRRR